MDRRKVVIDGQNASYLQAPRDRRPNIKNILEIIRVVEASGREPVIVLDPSIRLILADVRDLEILLSDPRLIPVPEGHDPGGFVLETADRLDALIISNNTFVEHYEDYPWIEERRIPVAIVNQTVLLLEKIKQAS